MRMERNSVHAWSQLDNCVWLYTCIYIYMPVRFDYGILRGIVHRLTPASGVIPTLRQPCPLAAPALGNPPHFAGLYRVRKIEAASRWSYPRTRAPPGIVRVCWAPSELPGIFPNRPVYAVYLTSNESYVYEYATLVRGLSGTYEEDEWVGFSQADYQSITVLPCNPRDILFTSP